MHQKGMTLVELIIVMAVASIIGLALLNMFITSTRTFMDQNKIIDVQRDGRLVMEYVTRTLREAGLNPTNSSAFQRVRFRSNPMDATKITIDRDSNLNGTLDGDTEIVSFEFDDSRGILMRGVNESPVVWRDIAKNINSFSLEYFDETSGVVAFDDPESDIRSIDVTIVFQDTKALNVDFTRTYKTRVDLRNF